MHGGGGVGGGWDGSGGGGGLTFGGGGGAGGEGGGGGWTPAVRGDGALDELVHELATVIVGLSRTCNSICSL